MQTPVLNNNYNYNGLEMDKKNFIGESNNCYTYAINQPFNPYTNKPYSSRNVCQPGYLGGKVKQERDKFLVRENFKYLIECAKADLKDIGYTIVPSNFKEYIPEENAWKVAFCYGSDDYHWYRLNKDGTWSHKKGFSGTVTNLDEDGKIIYNPEYCNRGGYNHFVGFFIIKKINIEKINYEKINYEKILDRLKNNFKTIAS